MITGTTDNSRLQELRKYTVSPVFANQYVGGGNWTTDGVDYPNSPTIEYVVYYLGGIKYTDITLIDGTYTTFKYAPNNTYNFIDEQYIKNPNKEKVISNPKIYDDVFITRDNLSAFNKNYKLEYIRNLVDLTTYAGGKYFNIISNT
jgi:hypothetical protein